MFHHLVLDVENLEHAARFYGDVLGLQSLGRDVWPEEAPNLTFETDESDYVVLVESPQRRPIWPGECIYISVTPDQWREVHGRLEATSCPVATDPKGGIRAAGELRVRVRDPDGRAVEIHAFEPSFYEQPAATRGKIVAGHIEQFPMGSVTRFPEGKFYLVRLAGGFLAISEVCTHRQFTICYQPEHYRFYCPLHGNRYSRTGQLVHRGAREETLPLHVYAIEFVDGAIVVDTDTSIPRAREEADRLVQVSLEGDRAV